MFAHRGLNHGVGVAVTDRSGGVSRAPWASLNLADHVGDDAGNVVENRRRVAVDLGVTAVATMRQVHGATVAVVDAPLGEPAEADALVTTLADVALLVLVADCTPVLLSDHGVGVVAAVHAGRQGLAAGVLPATLDVMTRLRARPDRIAALVGPAICPEHYEVPPEMQADVARRAPGSAATTRRGTTALDIRAGLLRQLRDGGVRRPTVLKQCTAEDDRFFSHRRDGVTGRFAGLIWRTS